MDIEKIKMIVNSDLPDQAKESAIINLLSRDENLIPTLMRLLQTKRAAKNELIGDMNLELSRAHIYIEQRPERKNESCQRFSKSFVVDKIEAFYAKHKSFVIHCFNRFN